MDKSILSNQTLEDLVKKMPLEEEQKSRLISDIPYMDENDRIDLLDIIKDIFIIEEDKKETIRKIKKEL